jgi:hypothetical protein
MENYIINRNGTIFSKKRNKYLKPYDNGKGYLRVDVSINDKRKTYTVHRLVAEKYIPNPNDLPQVNHIDGNKQNNNVENLEWTDNMNNCQSWNKLNDNFGSISIRPSGKVRYIIKIYGKNYSCEFDNWCEAEFYRLILKYCAYIKYR